MEELNNEEYLQHYGVLGMRWGIRKGNASGAYEKASKKLQKLNNKVVKTNKKANKDLSKAIVSSWGGGLYVNKKRMEKAAKSQQKYVKAVYKANKWLQSMEKEFAKTDINVKSIYSELGEQYVNTLMQARSDTMNAVRNQKYANK